LSTKSFLTDPGYPVDNDADKVMYASRKVGKIE